MLREIYQHIQIYTFEAYAPPSPSVFEKVPANTRHIREFCLIPQNE